MQTKLWNIMKYYLGFSGCPETSMWVKNCEKHYLCQASDRFEAKLAWMTLAETWGRQRSPHPGWQGMVREPDETRPEEESIWLYGYIWRFATAVHARQIEVVTFLTKPMTNSAVGSEVLTHKDHGRAPPGRRNPGLCQERCQAAWKGVVVSEAALHLGHGYKGKPHYI